MLHTHSFQTQDETSMKVGSRPIDATEEHARPREQTHTDRQAAYNITQNE